MTFDYKSAKEAGYSDEEIISYLSKDNPDFDVKAAMDSGYSPDEIVNYLSKSSQEQKPDYSDIQKRYKTAQEDSSLSVSERMNQTGDIYKEAYDIAKQNLGIEKRNPNPQQRKQIEAEADKILKRRGFAGGGIAPSTTQEAAQMPEATKFAARGIASGLTFGATQNLEDEEVPEEFKNVYKGGELLAEVIPLEGLFKAFSYPAKFVEIPYFKNAVSSVGNVLKSAGVGATQSAIKQAFKGKMPSPEEMAKEGVIWGALDLALQGAGRVGRTLKELFKRNHNAGGDTGEVVKQLANRLAEKNIPVEDIERVGQETIDILSKDVAENQTPAQAAKSLRDRKVEKFYFEDLSQKKLPQEPSQPYIPIEKELQEPISEDVLDTLTPRAESEQALGQSVKEDISNNVKEAKATYEPYYEEAAQEAVNKNPNANSVVRKAHDKFMKIGGRFKTKPKNYDQTLGQIENIMEDLGAIFERDAKGNITGLLGSNEVPLEDIMELGRRTGDIANWEGIGYSVKKEINSLNREIKKFIRQELASNPQALKAWETAEANFAKKAKTFDNKVIRKIRDQNYSPEDIVNLLKKPSDLEKLKAALSPEEFARVERELLSTMNNQSYEKAKSTFRELKKHMTDDGKYLAEEILTSKKPIKELTSAEKNAQMEKWITKELSKPRKSESLLKEWSTPKGRENIKKALKDNPNRDEIINYLEQEQLFRSGEDIIKQSGEMDFKEYSKWISDKANRAALKEQIGEEGLKFLDFVNNYQRRISTRAKVMNQLKKTPLKNFSGKSVVGDQIIDKFKKRVQQEKYPYITKAEDLWEKLPQEVKSVGAVFGALKFGPVKVMTALGGKEFMIKAAKSPRLRNAIREALTSKSTNPYVIYSLWKTVDEASKASSESNRK